MIRLIFPGGCLTSAQLKAVAHISSELQSDSAGITPQQDLRLQDLPADRVPDVLRRLAEAGITAEQGPAAAQAAPSAGFSDTPDQAGVYEQGQPGLFTLAVPVLAGRLSSAQMRKLADLTERYAGGSLQLAPRQKLLISNVPKERVAQVLEGLESVDLRVAVSSYHRGFTSCAEGAESRARELVSYLEKQVPLEDPFRIHLAGGDCVCGISPPAQIALRGTQVSVEDRMIEAYDVSVLAQPAASANGVPGPQVKYRLERLLTHYKRGREPAESFDQFCRRLGPEELARLLSEE